MKIIGHILIIAITLITTSCGIIDTDKIKKIITGKNNNIQKETDILQIESNNNINSTEVKSNNTTSNTPKSSPKAIDGTNWSPGYISLYDFWYNFPSGYSSKERTSDHGCHILTYNDGIEITISGTCGWGGKDLLKELYQSAIGSNPVFKVYKNDWYVISDDNGDGTEYYTRSGVIVTHPDLTNNEASPIIATMTITYPISAKLHAQEFIQKYFKGFPKSHQINF